MGTIVNERIVDYINSLDKGNSPVCNAIEKEALADGVPIIRKEMQSFLKLLLAMQKPMRILEVGTAVGFSAVLMAEYSPKDCQLRTMKNGFLLQRTISNGQEKKRSSRF